MIDSFVRGLPNFRKVCLSFPFRSFVICAGLLTSIQFNCQRCSADLILSLASDAPNLSQLPVGSALHMHVVLAGLGGGEELTELSARVEFSALQLGTPALSAGAIIPNPLADPLDFTVLPGPGEADSTFLTVSTATTSHITSNGIFFDFVVQPLTLGHGTFQLVFADAQQIDPNDPGNLISPPIILGSPLDFTAVPEPSGVSLLMLGMGFFTTVTRRRFRK